jgi:hypothetical protein
MDEFNCKATNNSPTWGLIDVFYWLAVPSRFGGGRPYIQQFKDAWVMHNKTYIQAAATKNDLPLELLAGVCWIEVGGDPNFIDRVAFEVRSFDWSGPPVIDQYLTITRNPTKTSFGSVSIQLRTAAQTLGLSPSEMTNTQLRSLADCLERDVYNIDTVASHLRQLADHDHFSRPLTMENIRIVGARYNRGTGLTVEEIKKDTSYGNFIVNNWQRFSQLVR